MEKVTLTLEVPKEVHDIGLALESIMKSYKLALADGFQPMQDVPAVLLGAVTELMKAMDGFSQVDDDFKQDALASAQALLIPIMNGLKVLLEKK